MRIIEVAVVAATRVSGWLVLACLAACNVSLAASPAHVTVLYDAFGKAGTGMTQDWGYSALVEIDGKRILFDTGDNAEILAKNVKAKGVDLTNLDFVVLSHRHADHVSGLSYVLHANPKVKIYAPKDGLGGIFGSDVPSKFYRKDASLPADMRYYAGSPPEPVRLGTLFPTADIELIDKTTEIAPGLTLIALVSDVPGTKELKEISLAINSPDGLVLIVGCSHPGIQLFVAEAAKINPHIHLVAGGFHMVAADDAAIAKTVEALHDTYKVDFIAPGHCTGEPTFAALKRAFGDRYLYAGLGTVIGLGAIPKVLSDRGEVPTMDATDYVSYRALATQSDEWSDAVASAALLARTENRRE